MISKGFRFLLYIILFVYSSQLWAQGNRLRCDNEIDVGKFKGQTYLSFMKEKVKPALDKVATEGYLIADADTVVATLDLVSSKVKRGALRGARGKQNLRKLAKALEGERVTLYNLPDKIADVSKSYDRYDLSTYFGLASCGGVTLKFDDNNFAYNIHYGTGKEERDERTGRSFGEGPSRDADDASDKAYLTDLEEYIKSGDEASQFYSTLLQTLTATHPKDYDQVSDFGQTLLTDFLAVYTAEQDRNLMDGRVWVHWDAALLEVTLLSAFHRGQEKIKLLYLDPKTKKTVFTDQTYRQTTGCNIATADLKIKKASLVDYWQFSKNDDPEHCRRSGINITKGEFRQLGKVITAYMSLKHPAAHKNLIRHFKYRSYGNVFYGLSRFLINNRTPKRLGSNAYRLSDDFVKYLSVVTEEARAIEAELEKKFDNL